MVGPESPYPALLILLLTAQISGTPLAAQSTDRPAFGIAGSAGLFVGDTDLLDGGLGIDVHLSRPLAPKFRLRVDAMLTRMVGQSASSVGGNREGAGNTIVMFGLGPEFGASLSRMGFYVRGVVGLAANFQGRSNSPNDENTTWAMVGGGGAGIRLQMAPGLALDLGGDVLKLGELEFARPSATTVRPEDSALLRLRVGVRFTTN